MMKFVIACVLVVLTACSSGEPEIVVTVTTVETTPTPTLAPQVASGTDSNVYTAKFAASFCVQDAQGLYDSLANGTSIKNGLDSESEYYARMIDQDAQSAAVLVAQVGAETGTDVTAMLAALDAKAAALKAQNSPVAILAAEIKPSDGTTCAAITFKGSFTDRYGGYNAIYIITYARADGTSDENFYVLSAGNIGVDDIH